MSSTTIHSAIPDAEVNTAAVTGTTWLAPPFGGWGLIPNQTPRGFWTALGRDKNLQMGRQGTGKAPLTVGWGWWAYKRTFNYPVLPGTAFFAYVDQVNFIRKLNSGGNMVPYATIELREDLGGGRLGPPIVDQKRLSTGQDTFLLVRAPKYARYRLTVGTSLRGAYQNYESPYGEIFANFRYVRASAPVALAGEPASLRSENGGEMLLEIEDFEEVREFLEARGDVDPEAQELGSDAELAASEHGAN